MKQAASIQVANVWANVAAIFLFIGAAIVIAAMIWEPRGFPMCVVPLTVAFVAKQGEVRLLRSVLKPREGGIS